MTWPPVMADAMTVEAVPTTDLQGRPYSDAEIKAKHTTMQTLGRFSIISGLVLVAAINIFMFRDVEGMDDAEKPKDRCRMSASARSTSATWNIATNWRDRPRRLPISAILFSTRPKSVMFT